MEKKNYKFYCDKCNYGCIFKSEYYKHCNTGLHRTGKRKTRSDKTADVHKCDKCTYETTNIGNYKIHVLNNHADEETRIKSFKHYCKKCRFGTNIKSVFERHKETKRHKMINS